MRLLLAVAVVAIAATLWLWPSHQHAGLSPASLGRQDAATGEQPVLSSPAPSTELAHGDVAGSVDDRELPAVATRLEFLVLGHDRRPVEGARVIAVDGERELARARSDAHGRAELRAVAPDVDYRVERRGHLTMVARADPACREQVVVLAAAPELAGRVIADTGLPVVGARAVLLPPLAGRLAAPAVLAPDAPIASSDARGAFALPWPDSLPRDLVVTAPGFGPTVRAGIDLRSFVGGIVVTLRPGARLVGQVMSAAGRPLPGARVEVHPAGVGHERSVRALGAPQPWRSGQVLAVAVTDVEGQFTCADLPAGLAWTTIASLGPAGGQPVWLVAGERSGVTLTAPALATVAGQLPGVAAGTQVFLHAASTRLTTVGDDGSFRFELVPPGRYLAGVRREPFAGHLAAVADRFAAVGHAPQVVLVDVAPGERREIEVVPTASSPGGISGEAFVGAAPASGCRVVVLAVAAGGPITLGARPAIDVQPDGSFRILDLSPGDYVVRLLAAEGAQVLAETSCRVLPGDTTLLALRST